LAAALPEHRFVAGLGLDDLGPAATEMEALIVSTPLYDAALRDGLVACARRLEWLQCLSSGADHLLAVGLPSGVILTTASGAHANGVAEHAAALILAALRRLPDLARAQAAGRWERTVAIPGTLEGAEVAILGFGHIGQALARRLRPFGAIVTGVNRTGTPAREEAQAMLPVPAFAAAADRFDVIALCLPATPATAGILGPDLIARLRPGVIVVNVGRGDLADEEAVGRALDAGTIGHYATDVTRAEPLPPGHPFWRHPRVTLTPHLAGRNPRLLDHVARVVAANIRARAAGLPLANRAGPGE